MLSAGKTLDPEQLNTLNSKKSVEKALADVAALRAQLEEVAKAELEASAKALTTITEASPVEEAAAEETAVAATNTDPSSETANVETNTEAAEQAAVSTMTETSTPAPVFVAPAPVVTYVIDQDAINAAVAAALADVEQSKKAELDEKLAKFLKVLHVYQRYKDLTGNNVPDTVDFFGRTLLGQTTISGFSDTLNHSLRVANFYLHVSC